MQHKISEFNLDYGTVGHYFQGKTEEEILAILTDYYERKKTLKDIASELGENVHSSHLRKHFPKAKSKVTCKHDGTPFYIDLPNKQNYQKDWLETVIPYCLHCGHQDLEACECEQCLGEQRRKIQEAYPKKEEKLVEDFSMYEKVVLATLLQGMHVKKIDQTFGPFDEFDDEDGPLFVESDDAYQKLQHLLIKRIISVSSESSLNSFVKDDDFPQTIYTSLVSWELNVASEFVKDREQLFKYLKYPSGSSLSEDKAFDELWCDIIKQELVRCVCLELKKYHFSFKHDNDKEKIEDQIIRLLELYNPGQIYALFWTAVRYADNSRTSKSWGNYAYNHINFVLKKVDEIEQSKSKKQETIDTFDYPKNLSMMLFTKVFFQEIAHEPNWFYKKAPKTDQAISLEDKSRFYAKLLNREKQQFKAIDLKIDYYYVTSYGVVVNDGSVDWLFTDEKTLYQIAEKVGFEEHVVSQDTFYSNLQTPYCINDMYSTSYLIELTHFLVKSQYKYWLPPKDVEFKNKLENLYYSIQSSS